jgi:hypothetical protein
MSRRIVSVVVVSYSHETRIASSNTFCTPSCVNAEHSRYLAAPISFCIPTPCMYVTGAVPLHSDSVNGADMRLGRDILLS